MGLTADLVSRRSLLRIGAYAGAAALISPLFGDSVAEAESTPTPCPTPISGNCNPVRPTTSSEALTALTQGNGRWAASAQEHPGEDQLRRCCLVNGQQPFASILSCSDSRVPPELAFDQGLGDLFVVRVAGNSNTVVGEQSLAYSVDHLSVPSLLLFVLGHQSCGAVSAAVDSYPDRSAQQFLKNIYPAVRSAKRIVKQTGGNPNDKSQVLPVAIDQNVILTMQELSKKHPFREAIHEGHLMAVGGRYDLTTQQVTVLSQISA